MKIDLLHTPEEWRRVESSGSAAKGDPGLVLTAERLRGFRLFASLTQDELQKLAGLCHVESYPAGHKIFLEGNEADRFYLLAEGKVALEKEIKLGPHSSARPATVEILGPGESFGWSALTAPYIYTMSGICLEPSWVLCFEAKLLRRLLDDNPRIGYEIMQRVASTVGSRLRETTKTLTYFLSIVAHELKAPLAAVESYMQVMLGGYTGELTEKQRTMIERSSLRLGELASLIGNILDLARMSAEQIMTEFETMAPAEIVEKSLDEVRLSAKEKNITLNVYVAEMLPEIVAAPNRVRQIFTNLLSNAIKFTPPEGQVTLRVEMREEGLWAEVIDTGPGIAPDDQPRIFEGFYRGRSAEGTKGLGLGLSIVKRIVDAHRGTITFESPYPPEGQGGTRFVVMLPKNPRVS